MTYFLNMILVFSICVVLATSLVAGLLVFARVTKRTHKKIYKKLIICFMIIMLFVVVSIGCGLKKKKITNTPVLIPKEEVHSEEYEYFVGNVVFQNALVNKIETDWETILNSGLGFSGYAAKNQNGITPCVLRDKYFSELSDPLEQHIGIETLLWQMIDRYSGTDILPKTNWSLDEIQADILPYKERINTSADVFKKEVYVRSEKCKGNPSGDNFYQLARAADDVTKTLIESKMCTLKELLFYSYLAVSCYKISMEYEDRGVPECMVLYKLSMIYIFLYEYGGYSKDSDYNKHFLLLGESYMRMAKQKYMEGAAGNINDYLPECDYYLSAMLHNFIELFNCDNKEIKDYCVECACDYMKYAGLAGRHYKECKQYVETYLDK